MGVLVEFGYTMTKVTFLKTPTTTPLEDREVRLALTNLKKHIAQRVRDARSQMNMSRRILAQASGVSQLSRPIRVRRGQYFHCIAFARGDGTKSAS